MEREKFESLVQTLDSLGYGPEINWQRELQPCESAEQFGSEAIWVILNSGMKEQIARIISDRIYSSIEAGKDISSAFGHKGKVAAIKSVLNNRDSMFAEYKSAADKVGYLLTIPFIGKITCWHLAKNLGHDCVKPDRHLVRIANIYKTTPDEMCQKLATETGERKCVIDIVIWRSCNLALI